MPARSESDESTEIDSGVHVGVAPGVDVFPGVLAGDEFVELQLVRALQVEHLGEVMVDVALTLEQRDRRQARGFDDPKSDPRTCFPSGVSSTAKCRLSGLLDVPVRVPTVPVRGETDYARGCDSSASKM
jgi:hypothetical protein